MSAYSEQVLVDKLKKLSATQQSIQTLSHWIMYHRKRYAQSVKRWYSELLIADTSQKLTFLYLANDVMQQSRRKGGEFIKEFSSIMGEAITHVIKSTSAGTEKQVLRLISIWEERRVFPKAFLDPIVASVKGQTSKPAKDTLMPLELRQRPEKPRSNDPIQSIKSSIEKTLMVKDMLVDDVKAIRSDLLDGKSLSDIKNQLQLREHALELDEGCKKLEQLKDRLTQENKLRNQLTQLLEKALEDNKKSMETNKTALEDCTKKLAQTEERKLDMKKLLSELPEEKKEVVGEKRKNQTESGGVPKRSKTYNPIQAILNQLLPNQGSNNIPPPTEAYIPATVNTVSGLGGVVGYNDQQWGNYDKGHGLNYDGSQGPTHLGDLYNTTQGGLGTVQTQTANDNSQGVIH